MGRKAIFHYLASSNELQKLLSYLVIIISVPEQDHSPLPLPFLYKCSRLLNANLWATTSQISLRRYMVQFVSILCGQVPSTVADLCHLSTFFNPANPSKAVLVALLLAVLLWGRGRTALNSVDSFPGELPKGAAERAWDQFEGAQPWVRLMRFMGWRTNSQTENWHKSSPALSL